MRALLAAVAVAAPRRGARRPCVSFAPGYYGYLLGTLATTALAGIGLNILLGLSGEVFRSGRAGLFWRLAPMASRFSPRRAA